MKRILLFCAMGALWGCRTVTEPTTEAITLCCSTSEQSKTDALTVGDEVAVFARLDGTETYFLEGEKFITGSDGKTLSRMPAMYYPETKQAVEFFAYFPYHTGSFSVPTDQSTVTALKQADLCWATTKSTPIAIVPLTFQHLFARLVVQTNEPASKIACLVVPSGVLNAATAQFTLNGGKSEVSTTGVELILPPQTINRLVLAVSGVEYIYDGSINLQSGQTTTLNLTLHPSTKTATLNGSSTTAWTTSATQGNATEAVSNILTLHWANYVPQGATPDKIILTINNADYTINSGITYANKTFTVPFASNQLRYPYTISKIAFSTTPLACNQLLGATIYKSGTQSVGIKDVPNAVLINGVWWAIGNLVADGPNGCKIGAPTDCGLDFQFGSLLGWRAGSAPDYDGTGAATPTSLAVKVKPLNFDNTYDPKTTWPTGASSSTLDKPYFAIYTAPYNSLSGDINRYAGTPLSGSGVDVDKENLGTGRYAPMGVGDPCTYYLGPLWVTPTITDIRNLFGQINYGGWGGVSGCTVTASLPYSVVTKTGFPSLIFPFSGGRGLTGDSWAIDKNVVIHGRTTEPNQASQSASFILLEVGWPNQTYSYRIYYMSNHIGYKRRCVSYN